MEKSTRVGLSPKVWDDGNLAPEKEEIEKQTQWLQQDMKVEQRVDMIGLLEKKRDLLSKKISDIEELCNITMELESHGAALCGAEGADNERSREAHGIMAPGLAHIVLGIRTLIYGQEATDLILDIKTACSNLYISDNRKSASRSKINQVLPQTPERFYKNEQVISSRSFHTGRHYWELEINESGGYGIGVAYASMDREGDWSIIGHNSKSWCLYSMYDHYTEEYNKNKHRLPQSPSAGRFRISLDYEAGRLSFYELSEPIRHLHTFTATFTEPLHVIFRVWAYDTTVSFIR